LRLRERSETASTSRMTREGTGRTHGVHRRRAPTPASSRVRLVLEDVITPSGPYRLRLMAREGRWSAPVQTGVARAWQRPDGRVAVRAPDEDALARARFMLALDDDTAEFHARFARDALLGPSARALVGYRPLRLATVAHAALRAVVGQLIESRRARAIERSILRALGTRVATREQLLRLSPLDLRRHGLAQHRASTLARLVAGVDLERLRQAPGDAAIHRLARERGIGPWSIGVISLEGLGRYDRGLVGDLALVKLAASLRGRWPETWETAELLEPYGEWQGLAGEVLLLGWSRGLVPGADADVARHVRMRTKRAA
jgi:3-methyladenine DNA glycosylase/8-oxoguanine DNA glycosylase